MPRLHGHRTHVSPLKRPEAAPLGLLRVGSHAVSLTAGSTLPDADSCERRCSEPGLTAGIDGDPGFALCDISCGTRSIRCLPSNRVSLTYRPISISALAAMSVMTLESRSHGEEAHDMVANLLKDVVLHRAEETVVEVSVFGGPDTIRPNK